MSLRSFIFLKHACWLQKYVLQSIFTLFSSATILLHLKYGKDNSKITFQQDIDIFRKEIIY